MGFTLKDKGAYFSSREAKGYVETTFADGRAFFVLTPQMAFKEHEPLPFLRVDFQNYGMKGMDGWDIRRYADGFEPSDQALQLWDVCVCLGGQHVGKSFIWDGVAMPQTVIPQSGNFLVMRFPNPKRAIAVWSHLSRLYPRIRAQCHKSGNETRLNTKIVLDMELSERTLNALEGWAALVITIKQVRDKAEEIVETLMNKDGAADPAYGHPYLFEAFRQSHPSTDETFMETMFDYWTVYSVTSSDFDDLTLYIADLSEIRDQFESFFPMELRESRKILSNMLLRWASRGRKIENNTKMSLQIEYDMSASKATFDALVAWAKFAPLARRIRDKAKEIQETMLNMNTIPDAVRASSTLFDTFRSANASNEESFVRTMFDYWIASTIIGDDVDNLTMCAANLSEFRKQFDALFPVGDLENLIIHARDISIEQEPDADLPERGEKR